jgi:hypothetical protein
MTHPSRRLARSARGFGILVAVAGVIVALSGVAASANTAPPQACGSTQPGPCTETDHFTQQLGFVTPIGQPSKPSNCPAFVLNDFPFLDFTGNGVEHVTLNKAQDFWATSTFTGKGTITLYPPSSLANLSVDNNGNVTADIVGPPDAVYSGKLQTWFGVSDNKQAGVVHDTINVQAADQAGNSIHLHQNSHTSWSGGSEPFVDPPHLSFAKIAATC